MTEKNSGSVWSGLRVPEFPVPFNEHWRCLTQQQSTPYASARESLERIANSQHAPSTMKGSPSLGALRVHAARELINLLEDSSAQCSSGVSSIAIERAHILAASSVKDAEAFCLYWNLEAHRNREAIASARQILRGQVILHMTCQSNIARARASIESFGPECAASHILLVGSPKASSFAFDAATRVMTVPTPDTYEHLPSKVIAAYFFLALCGSIDALVKIDDDHRLASASYLDALIEAVSPKGSVVALQSSFGSSSSLIHRLSNALSNPKRAGLRRVLDKCIRGRRPLPVILGAEDAIPFPGAHNRIWHLGKCSDESVSATPYALLAFGRYMQGGAGYVLNGYSLSVLAWCWVYFRTYIVNGLYEDLVVSQLLDRHGAVFLNSYLGASLTTVTQY